MPFPFTNDGLVELTKRFLQRIASTRTDTMDEGATQNSLLFLLPKEIIYEIYTYLTYTDLGRSLRVCKALQVISENSWLWRDFCNIHFPFYNTDAADNWKNIFKVHRKLQIGWTQGRPKDFKMTPWRAHTNYINCVDLYKHHVVSGGGDNDLNIWTFGKENALHTLKGHTGLVNTVRFNELWIISGSNDSTATVWDTSTGRNIKSLQHTGSVSSLFFNDTSLWTASGDRYIRNWDLRSGNQILGTLNGQYPVVKIEAGIGPHIITHDTQTVRLYDIRKNNAVALYNLNVPGITCTAYTSENRYAIGTNTGDMRVYNLNTGALLNAPKLHYSPITCIHADGDRVVTGSTDSTCKVWNIKTATIAQTLAGHKDGPVNAVQIDENRVVSGGSDMCLKVWNLSNGTSLYSLLGGSRQNRDNNPPHPTKAGCSFMRYDRTRIVAAFNSLLRVYSFDGT
jgi:WD40 repeat protein